MDEHPLAPLDWFNRIMIGVFLAVLAALPVITVAAALLDGPVIPIALLFLILGGAIAGCWAWSPRAVRVAPEGLVVVRRLLPPLVFRWSQFTRVESAFHWRGWKTFGTAGWFGYFGWFHGRDLGRFRCYATRRTGAVILRGTPSVVVTPADPERLYRAISAYVQPAA